MRTYRAYCPLTSINFNQSYSLLPSTSHHLAKVLRVKVGDLLEVFDGLGHRFEAQIQSMGKQLMITLLHALPSDTQSSIKLNLMVALGKGDKMEWIVQKATELGVTSIQTLITARSEVRLSEERLQRKQQHWQEIAINACEQSGLDQIPIIYQTVKLSELLSTQFGDNALKLLLHPSKESQPFQLLTQKESIHEVSLLIGPEGGFEAKEIALAKTQGFRLASLGPRTLRMETAAIASIAILQALGES